MPAPGVGYPLLVLAAPRLAARTGSGYLRMHWLLVWEVPSAAARTRSGHPTPRARLGSGRTGASVRCSDGIGTAFRMTSCDVLAHRYRGRTAPCDVLGHRYRAWTPSRSVLGARYRGRTRPPRVSDRHDRAWMARHAVPIAPSARGRVPDSRSCGEIAYLPNEEPVHSEVSRTRAYSETRSRKNEKRVPDPGRTTEGVC